MSEIGAYASLIAANLKNEWTQIPRVGQRLLFGALALGVAGAGVLQWNKKEVQAYMDTRVNGPLFQITGTAMQSAGAELGRHGVQIRDLGDRISGHAPSLTP